MGRTPCCDKDGLKRGPWTAEEDQKLIDYITKHGYGNWRTLPTNAGLQRCGKSCRLRWMNYLRPDIKRGRFSLEEEQIIIQLHSILGNKWSAIAARLPGRTDNEIKNYWNTHIKRKLLSRGIDPQTHRPLKSGPAAAAVAAAALTPPTPTPQQPTPTTSSGGLSSSEETTYLQPSSSSHLNLELSISLPQPDEEHSNSGTSSYAVCLCHKLGFQSGNAAACNCTKMAASINYAAARDGMQTFFRPLSL